jgi:hypothetical protein
MTLACIITPGVSDRPLLTLAITTASAHSPPKINDVKTKYKGAARHET